MKALANATSFMGPIDPKHRALIERYVGGTAVDLALWDRVHCIVIDGEGSVRTVWQSVCRLEPGRWENIGMPTEGQRGTAEGRWSEAPPPFTVYRALHKALPKKERLR